MSNTCTANLLLYSNHMFIVLRTMIDNMIKEGKIVPSEVTIKLLERAILETNNDKFLIDGSPCNEENRAAFESVVSLIYCQSLACIGFLL